MIINFSSVERLYVQFGSKIKQMQERGKREEEREINSQVRQVTKNQAQIFPYLTLYASPHRKNQRRYIMVCWIGGLGD
jgi:hypothetical protein